ncbi:KH domain-containing protein [Peptostreptococcus faecalis]|uniref:KH domain-containing protein n=1 Tax=Peptostreptococcus faecalis TaxID=2045015 RepID=UPI000C7AB8F8|nr:KH domain-containing protein [Peptostreptococcus faecalis]
MKDLVEGIAKALVDHPDKVEVEEIVDGKDILLKLKVADTEMGKVIGKKGRIAKSIRTVLKSVSNKNKVNVSLEIVED